MGDRSGRGNRGNLCRGPYMPLYLNYVLELATELMEFLKNLKKEVTNP